MNLVRLREQISTQTITLIGQDFVFYDCILTTVRG